MNIADELQKLQQLRESGALTDEEFVAAKAKLLGMPSERPRSTGNWNEPTEVNSSQDSQTRMWAMLLHFSILAGYAVPIAGLVVPIMIWQLKKDELPEIDVHGKNAANWIISELIYLAVSCILIFVVIGIPLVIILGVLGVVFPIIAAIKASNGEAWRYPMSISFLN